MNSRFRVFKEEPGFMKLFSLFRDKYRSLGRSGGFVSLKGFEESEIESIAGFLGLSAAVLHEKGRIGLAQFENELANTGYSDVKLIELLEAIFEEPLLSKKEAAEKIRGRENDFLDSLKEVMPKADWWISWLGSRSLDTRWIWSLFHQNEQQLAETMKKVFFAFQSLPGEGQFERLPFFSQRSTGNPHYFDIANIGGRLLIHTLSVYKKIADPEFPFPKSTEEINDLLADFGLLRDDLWNFVTVNGFVAWTQKGVHPVWEAAVQTETVLNVPMKELGKLEKIQPASGSAVWIVENSSVASTIMDAVPYAPVVCTHGQLRAAGWRLLDKLTAVNCTLFYSGDLDPEGILIADRLKKRYQNQLVLWRMDAADYEKSISEEDVTERISKLASVDPQFWKEMIPLLTEKKKAGYQEALVDLLIGDIKKYRE